MQIVTVTSAFIFSAACTQPMLFELAVHPFVGYSQEAVEKLMTQKLAKTSGNKGGKSAGVGDLEYAKLRTCVVNKLDNNPDINDAFKAGTMEFEFMCLADLDMGTAGANKSKRASGARTASAIGDLKGEYVIVKQGVKCSPETDAGKFEIWQHVWACKSFDEFFAKAPAKGVTKNGRVITARSEIMWALKSGWIKPVAA